MFDKFKNINFSKTYIEVSEVGLDIDLSDLENDIINILLSYNSSFDFCEEEMSKVKFSFDCQYFSEDNDDMDDVVVGEFIVAQVNLELYDAELDNEGEDFSFEFTYPNTLTYDELLYAYKLLIGNIFSVHQTE